MPGRTKCPTCGRPYVPPDRTCSFCAVGHEAPAVHLAEPPTEYHAPPSGIFRKSWSATVVWALVVTLLIAVSVLVVVFAVGAVSLP